MIESRGVDQSATGPAEPHGSLAVSPSEVLTTYHFLRSGVILAVAMLAVSVVYDRTQSTGFQTSISAYYYTPVRSVFVGALMVIGFSLIVIRGRPSSQSANLEDLLLNLAGMFAPVVALVPCDPGKRVLFETAHASIENNMLALLVVGFLAMVLSVAIGHRRRPRVFTTQDATGRITASLITAFVLLTIGAIGFVVWPAFEAKAHYIAAYVMFGLLGIVVILSDRDGGSVRYKHLYRAIWVSMGLSVIVVGLGSLVLKWRHSTLILEVLEITLFAAFWGIETMELWFLKAAHMAVLPSSHPPTSGRKVDFQARRTG